MPTAKVPIPNCEYTVSRNVIMSVVQELKHYTHMGSDLNILFPNESDVVPTAGSTIDDRDRKVPYLTKKVLHVEVEEDTDPEFMLNIHVNGRNNSPVVYDKQIGLVITPIYYKQNVTLTIKFRSDSKSEVMNWRNGIKTRLAAGAQFGLLHNLSFNFQIPGHYYKLLREVHRLRESNYPTGQSFDDYFKTIATNRITPVHDTNGAFRALTVQESQVRVLGIYELSELPEKPEKDEDTGTWIATLTYKFTYMKPEYMFIRYPVSVFNEFIPEEYLLHHNRDDDYRAQLITSHKNILDFHKFEMQKQLPRSDEAVGFVRYPYYDDKNLGRPFLGYVNIASFLVGIGEDKRYLLNLGDLGDFVIQQDILDWIKEEEYRYIGKPHKSVIAVFLKRNDDIISYTDLDFDKDLNIKSNHDLDLRDEHRIVISIAWDWQGLDRDAIARAQRYPNAFKWIIAAINRALLEVTYVYNYNVNEGDPFRREYKPEDFDLAIAALLGRDPVGSTYPTSTILSRAPQKLLDLLRRKSKSMKTVFASSIVTVRQDQ